MSKYEIKTNHDSYMQYCERSWKKQGFTEERLKKEKAATVKSLMEIDKKWKCANEQIRDKNKT